MPYDLALFDLISPYVLRGDTFGAWHAALSVIYVSEYTVAADDGGIVIRGVGKFSGHIGQPTFDPSTMTLSWAAENTEGHPASDPGRRDPWIDIRDSQIEFELSAPRAASLKVTAAVSAIGNAGSFANAAAVLNAYDSNAAHPSPSDYASTEFIIDLLLTAIVLRLPFLRGAKLDPSGILVADPTAVQVKITLPKIKARLQQGSNANDPLTATLLSLGASGLDDQDDFGVADLITMDPPYAFIGPSDVVGFGFRTAMLDLSDGSTPPDVLAQFGFDDSWTGLYLPEIRIYVAPEGAQDLAFDASATDLLIGIGASAGITGDFELAVVDQGSGPVTVSARFYTASGRCYGITKSADGKSATVTIPDQTRMVVDIDGGLTPYTASAKIGNAADAPGRLFDISFGSDGSLTIVITATGSQPGATATTLTITAALQVQSALPPPGSAQTPDNPVAAIQTTSVTQGGSAVSTPQLSLVSQTASQATVGLDANSPVQAAWTVGGTAAGTSFTVTVDCAPGATVQVQAVVPDTPGANGGCTFYYRYNHPNIKTESDPIAYALVPNNTSEVVSPDPGTTSPWPPNDAGAKVASLLAGVPAATPITIKGYASFEPYDTPTWGGTDWTRNNTLATNRAAGLAAIIAKYASTTFTSVTSNPDMLQWGPTQELDRNTWWKATATWAAQTLPGTTTTGTVSRPAAQPPQPVPVPDNPQNATAPPPPSWFKEIDVKVRIVRDHLVACEISGKFDIQTPSETQLANGGVPNQQIPTWGDVGSQNPADGIIDIRVIAQIDDATDIIQESVYFGADPADLDGLKYIGWLPPAPAQLPDPGYGQNFFGLGVAFWPLIADAAGAAAGDGAAVELAVDAAGIAVVAGMAALPWFRVEHIIWYGGELDLQTRPDGYECLVLMDVEAAISADVSIGPVDILSIDRRNPLTVRYKAIGFIIGNPPGQAKFPFRPYFDLSKGYTIDVSKPGAIQVHDPFDKILKILGARLSRNNPFFVEVDLGFAVDLGVVQIDRARVRLNLSPGGPPEITAFGASVNIPGALQGSGYAEVGTDAQGNSVIKGAMDLTITPVNVRIAATLAVAQISAANGGPATGIQVSLEVDFPVAIPLADFGPRHLRVRRPLRDELPARPEPRARQQHDGAGARLAQGDAWRRRQPAILDAQYQQLGVRRRRAAWHRGHRHHLQHEGHGAAGAAGTAPAHHDEGERSRRDARSAGRRGRHVSRRHRSRFRPRHADHRARHRFRRRSAARDQHPGRGVLRLQLHQQLALLSRPVFEPGAGDRPAGLRRVRLPDGVGQRHPGAQQSAGGDRVLDRDRAARLLQMGRRPALRRACRRFRRRRRLLAVPHGGQDERARHAASLRPRHRRLGDPRRRRRRGPEPRQGVADQRRHLRQGRLPILQHLRLRQFLAVRQHGADPQSAQPRQVAQAHQPLAGSGGRQRDGQADRFRALPTRSRATPVSPPADCRWSRSTSSRS